MGAGESAGYWNLWLLGSKLKKIRRKMCDVNHFSMILLFLQFAQCRHDTTRDDNVEMKMCSFWSH